MIFVWIKDVNKTNQFTLRKKVCSNLLCPLVMEEEQIDFKLEAEAVIADIGFAVKSISLSTKLPSSRECVFLNVLTKECQSMCIELSILGFRVSAGVVPSFNA